MNKFEFIDYIKDFYESPAEAKRNVNYILNKIIEVIKKEGNLSFRGFGSFKKVKIGSHKHRNFKKDKLVETKPYLRVYFKSGRYLKGLKSEDDA